MISADRFQERLKSSGFCLTKGSVEILQVNMGKLCNMACVHCHVEAGPTRIRENMDRKTAEAVVAYMKNSGIETLDLTGGATEMNPNFRYLVAEARRLGRRVMARSNLTILLEPGYEGMSDFLAGHQVEIVASMPCYLRENVDKQRGEGTFSSSVEALRRLNGLGYGIAGTGLILNLVYNPAGPHLPPAQAVLESDYRVRLREDAGIEFTSLYTITNMPITRYRKYLEAFGQLESYQELLSKSFNPSTVDGLMCRNMLSVGWDGKLYDCDFNQMMGMALGNGTPLSIESVTRDLVEGGRILTAEHCFGCTAGVGSSCRGTIQ